MTNNKKINLTDLFLFIVSAELTGVLSALLSGNFSGTYAGIPKPPLSPPAWLFPAVWTVLYAVMGISAYLIYSCRGTDSDARRNALAVYWVQLFVNFSWSIVFFRLKLFAAAAAVILTLLMLIAVMIKMFRKIRPAAGYMNIPYLIWVIFASYLNIAAAVMAGSR